MRNLLSLFIFIGISNVIAQSITTSPLSYYGIGEQTFGSNAIYSALGQNTISFFDSTQLNYFNPASYSSLSTGNTLLSIGINARSSTFSEQEKQKESLAVMPDHFVLGFKLHKRIGLAFGLKPYTQKGYEITEIDTINSLQNSYEGNGGTQALFLGAAYRVINLKNSKLSVGANAAYLFGSLTNSRKSRLLTANSDFPAGISNATIKLIGLNLDLGFSFDQIISKKQSFCLNSVYSPNVMLQNSTLSEGLYYAQLLSNAVVYDTISYSNNGIKFNNSSLKFGFSYTWNLPNLKRDTRLLHPCLTLVGTFSNLKSKLLVTESTMNHYGIGVQFSPETKILQNRSNLKFLEKISYRVGYYFQNNTISNLANKVQNNGLTFGFGIPILSQQSLSSINIGFNIGKLKSDNSTTFTEEYLGVNFGIIFAPANFERWFRKRKLD